MTTATGVRIQHHGAVRGVTGSCHRLTLPDGRAASSRTRCCRARRLARDGLGAAAADSTRGYDLASHLKKAS